MGSDDGAFAPARASTTEESMSRSKLFVLTITVCGAFALAAHAQSGQLGGQAEQQKQQPSGPLDSSALPTQQPSPDPMVGHEGHDMPGSQMGGMQGQRMGPEQITQFIQAWPEESKKAAEQIIQKYGQPNEMTQSMLVWHNAGQFKHVKVYKEAYDHDFPMPHKDVVAHVVDYKVPVDKFDDLAQFNGSLEASRTKGELTARCSSEEMNILALNVADQIVRGQRSATNARDFFGRLALQVQKSADSMAMGGGPIGAPGTDVQATTLPREATMLLVDVTKQDTEDKDRAVRAAR
jgi:hypothetical protein